MYNPCFDLQSISTLSQQNYKTLHYKPYIYMLFEPVFSVKPFILWVAKNNTLSEKLYSWHTYILS